MVTNNGTQKASASPSTAPYLAVSLVLVVIIATLFGHTYHGHEVVPADADPEDVSAERAFLVLTDLLGNQQPHPVGSAANDVVRRGLVRRLRDLNYDVTEFCHAETRASVTNVLASLPGDHSRRPILLVTHYDSHPIGPGAGDAGSCVAALLETARALTHHHKNKATDTWPTVFFLFTDAEEAGLVGADLFVSNDSQILKQNPLVLNFDARGAAGPSLMYESSRNNLKLMQHLLPQLPRPAFTASSYVSVYDMLPNGTDFTEFKTVGMDGLNFAFIDHPHRYHTADDTLEHLDVRSIQHHADNAFLLLKHWIDNPVDDFTSDQNAVFFDILGQWVVCYPESYAIWFATIIVTLQLAGLLRAFKLEGHSEAILDSCAAMLVGFIGCVATGWAMSQAMLWLPRSSHGFGVGDPYLIAVLWLSVLTSMWLAFRFLGGKASIDSTWNVVWMLSAILGLASAVYVPGFSYIFLATGLVPSLLGIINMDRRIASVISIAIAAILLVPLGWQFGIALGVRMALVLSILYAMFLAPLYPLLTGERSKIH